MIVPIFIELSKAIKKIIVSKGLEEAKFKTFIRLQTVVVRDLHLCVCYTSAGIDNREKLPSNNSVSQAQRTEADRILGVLLVYTASPSPARAP